MRSFKVTIDGKSYSVEVEELGATKSAAATESVSKKVAESAPEVKAAPKQSAANATGEKVLSPFPGLIKNLLVAEGTAVKKDQAIIVLEAMKMDNNITAPCDGTITFNVAKGANVETNALLAVIG